jgi:hypothetical protein
MCFNSASKCFKQIPSFIRNFIHPYNWQKFRENISEDERLELIRRLNQSEERYNLSRNIAIDILKLYLQTVIALVAVPIVFQTNLLAIFGVVAIKYIYISWVLLLVSILLGFLSYFCIFEGYYHQAHFWYFSFMTPFYSIEESVRKSRESALKWNEIKQSFFLRLSHYLGFGTIALFCIAIIYIIKAVIFLGH